MPKGLIIGAGIAGLTAAVALRRNGADIEVYEAASALRPEGAGIWMAPNAMKVFARLGIADGILEAGLAVEKVAILDQHRRPIVVASQQGVAARHGFPIVAIHRSALQSAIRRSIPDEIIHLGKKLASLERSHRLTARFEDGTEAQGDFLIGADGINSTVRRELFGDIPLRYAGTTCWRGVADFDLPADFRRSTVELWGTQKRIGIAEINPGLVYWFAVESSAPNGTDAADSGKQQLLRDFEEFADPVGPLLQATLPDRIIRKDLYDLPPRRPWFRDSVCLIGDAAHPMTPDMGQGGAKAVEDAYLLMAEMAVQREPIQAFAAFEARRFSKVEGIVKQSYWFDKMIHLRYGSALRNSLFRWMPLSLSERMMDRVYDIPDADGRPGTAHE